MSSSPKSKSNEATKESVTYELKDVVEAANATLQYLPSGLRDVVSKLPRGPSGDPAVTLYQVVYSEVLRRMLEQEYPRLAEAVRLVSKEVPSALQGYVWYPVSGLLFRLRVTYDRRSGKWTFSLQPVRTDVVIGELASAYRRATRLETLGQASTYARLRALTAPGHRYVMPGMPAPSPSGWGLRELFAFLGLPIPVEEEEFVNRFQEVFGEPPDKIGLEVLRRIGFIIPKGKKKGKP